ncbi:MAG: PIN domain-containing protein [Puniceicoccaceae bacterium]
MRADFKVLLDACVLANFGVCDLLLRLAESPRLFLPVWSDEILRETHRTQIDKLGWPKDLAESFEIEIRKAFPHAAVNDYGHLIEKLENEEKDRHILAAAIRSGTSLIVTFNLKDFSESAIRPWGIDVAHPQDYLNTLYEMAPLEVVGKIGEIAGRRGIDKMDLLLRLGKTVPNFVSRIIEDLNLE